MNPKKLLIGAVVLSLGVIGYTTFTGPSTASANDVCDINPHARYNVHPWNPIGSIAVITFDDYPDATGDELETLNMQGELIAELEANDTKLRRNVKELIERTNMLTVRQHRHAHSFNHYLDDQAPAAPHLVSFGSDTASELHGYTTAEGVTFNEVFDQTGTAHLDNGDLIFTDDTLFEMTECGDAIAFPEGVARFSITPGADMLSYRMYIGGHFFDIYGDQMSLDGAAGEEMWGAGRNTPVSIELYFSPSGASVYVDGVALTSNGYAEINDPAVISLSDWSGNGALRLEGFAISNN